MAKEPGDLERMSDIFKSADWAKATEPSEKSGKAIIAQHGASIGDDLRHKIFVAVLKGLEDAPITLAYYTTITPLARDLTANVMAAVMTQMRSFMVPPERLAALKEAMETVARESGGVTIRYYGDHAVDPCLGRKPHG